MDYIMSTLTVGRKDTTCVVCERHCDVSKVFHTDARTLEDAIIGATDRINEWIESLEDAYMCPECRLLINNLRGYTYIRKTSKK